MELIKRIWGMLHQIEEAESLARYVTDEAAELSARVQELEARVQDLEGWVNHANPRLDHLTQKVERDV